MKRSRASRLRRLAGLLSLALVLAAAAALSLLQLGSEEPPTEGPGVASASAGTPAILQYRIAALDPSLVSSYQVNRTVTDFPEGEDLSTPEAVYATINRALARGDRGIWRRITADPMRVAALPPADAPPVDVLPETVRLLLGCHILEVWIYRGGANCSVIAEMPSPAGPLQYDVRSLELVDGRWLNAGNVVMPTLELARSVFAESCTYDDAVNEAHREAVERQDPTLQMAETLFERIRSTDYDYYLTAAPNLEVWKEFLDPGYIVRTNRPGWMNWVCTTFRENPIAEVELGEVSLGMYGRPTVPYLLTLEDGSVLQGRLPFRYFPDTEDGCRTGEWTALEGLDWHL